MWQLREAASDALGALGARPRPAPRVAAAWSPDPRACAGHVPFKFDVSLPVAQLYDLVEATKQRYSGRADVVVIGCVLPLPEAVPRRLMRRTTVAMGTWATAICT